MPITTFAFSGTSGDVANNIRGLVQTGGFKRYSPDIVQSGFAVVQFTNFYFSELEGYVDDGDAVSMAKMGIIMEGKIKQIDGEFPNGITRVQFSDNQEPKCTYAYAIDNQEMSFIANDLQNRFGVRNHLIEEPYQLPVNYTTDYFESVGKNGEPLTILNVNVVQAHNIETNAISRKMLGESLIVSECYAKPLEREMENEVGELYRQEEEQARLEAMDKAEAKKAPLPAPEEAAKLTPEEIALSQQSDRVGKYVDSKISEQDARRKLAEEKREEEERKKEEARLAEEAAKQEAEEKVVEKPAVKLDKPEAKAAAPEKFDQARLNALLGISDDAPGSEAQDDNDFGG